MLVPSVPSGVVGPVVGVGPPSTSERRAQTHQPWNGSGRVDTQYQASDRSDRQPGMIQRPWVVVDHLRIEMLPIESRRPTSSDSCWCRVVAARSVMRKVSLTHWIVRGPTARCGSGGINRRRCPKLTASAALTPASTAGSSAATARARQQQQLEQRELRAALVRICLAFGRVERRRRHDQRPGRLPRPCSGFDGRQRTRGSPVSGRNEQAHNAAPMIANDLAALMGVFS